MAYTKNQDPWGAAHTLTTTKMDNFETIYTEISSYLASHNHDALYQTKAESEAAYWYTGNDGPASGADADLLYKATGNLHAAGFSGLGIPTGLIVLWYGSAASIPAGWHICDGTGGTINLQDRYTVGAGTGSSYSVGDTGGVATFTVTGTLSVTAHSLTTAEMAAHTHTFGDKCPATWTDYLYTTWTSNTPVAGEQNSTSGSTTGTGSGTAHGHSGGEGTTFTGNAVSRLPFTKAFCYIQKTA